MKYYCQNLKEHPDGKPVEVERSQRCPGCKKEIDWNHTTISLFAKMEGYTTTPVEPKFTFS